MLQWRLTRCQFSSARIPVTLSTDDPGNVSHDLVTDIRGRPLAGLSNQQLLKLAEHSISAFLSPVEKRKFLDDFRSAAEWELPDIILMS